MTQTGPNINLIPNSPSLADLLNYWAKQIKLDTNCHAVGTIESFDPVLQTAQVSLNYTKTILSIDDVGNTSNKNPSYALLLSCPCIVLGGGGGYLSFPIEKGDECLVLFNDRDLDQWFATGAANAPPATGRLHGFSDAIVLVGLRSTPNVIVAYDDEAVTLSYEDNTVQIFEDSIEATLSTGESLELSADALQVSLADGEVSLELNAAGQLAITNETGEFVSALNTLFTDVSTATAGGFPVLMPTFPVDILVLQSFME